MRLPGENIKAPKWEIIFVPLTPKSLPSENPPLRETQRPETPI